MFYRLERRPDMVGMPVGIFADPDFPPPFEYHGEAALTGMRVTTEPPPERAERV